MKIPRASIWPTVTFDTTSVGGMANARAWVASLFDDEPAGRNVRVVQRTTGDTSDSAPSSPESAEGRTDDRAIYGPRHADRWTVRDGKAVVVGSNDWPPPSENRSSLESLHPLDPRRRGVLPVPPDHRTSRRHDAVVPRMRLLAAYIAVTGTIIAALCRAAARGDLPTDTQQRQEAA